jgi:hypothetical protein
VTSYASHVWSPERDQAARQLVVTAMNDDDDGFEKAIKQIDVTDMAAVAAILAELLADRFLAMRKTAAHGHGDCCSQCGGPVDHDPDDRTPAQRTADVAAATLARLTRITDEYEFLHCQLDTLADWAGERGLDEPTGYLEDFAAFARITGGLFEGVSDSVRDVAATLPLRGVDYGTETQ